MLKYWNRVTLKYRSGVTLNFQFTSSEIYEGWTVSFVYLFSLFGIHTHLISF